MYEGGGSFVIPAICEFTLGEVKTDHGSGIKICMWSKSLQVKALSFIFQDGIYKQESFHQIHFRKMFFISVWENLIFSIPIIKRIRKWNEHFHAFGQDYATKIKTFQHMAIKWFDHSIKSEK